MGSTKFRLRQKRRLAYVILVFYLRQVRLLQSETFFGGVEVRFMKSPMPVQLLSLSVYFSFNSPRVIFPIFQLGWGLLESGVELGLGLGERLSVSPIPVQLLSQRPRPRGGEGIQVSSLIRRLPIDILCKRAGKSDLHIICCCYIDKVLHCFHGLLSPSLHRIRKQRKTC